MHRFNRYSILLGVFAGLGLVANAFALCKPPFTDERIALRLESVEVEGKVVSPDNYFYVMFDDSDPDAPKYCEISAGPYANFAFSCDPVGGSPVYLEMKDAGGDHD